MRRLLLSPKWVGLTLTLIIVVVGCTALGMWQWTRIHQARVAEPPATGPPVALADLYRPGEPTPVDQAGRTVRLSGRYDASKQLVVPDRVQDGAVGYWVLTPLILDAGEVVPVVRGWASTATGGDLSPPTGAVSVRGQLMVSESDALRARGADPLPDGQIAIVSSAELASVWGGDLYQGFVVLTEQRPTSALPAAELPVQEKRPISWQSLAYTIQWWLFALFAMFFWWRMLQADLADLRSAKAGHDGSGQSQRVKLSEVGE